jgi:hypothetical protein
VTNTTAKRLPSLRRTNGVITFLLRCPLAAGRGTFQPQEHRFAMQCEVEKVQ